MAANESGAQGLNLIPNRKPQSSEELYQFDQDSVWALHLKPNAIVHSPLLRLKDVASPVENNPPWWDRVGNCVFAMMPLNDHEMVVERERLAEALARSTAIAAIQWSGETQVRVRYERPAATRQTQSNAASSNTSRPLVQATASLPVTANASSNSTDHRVALATMPISTGPISTNPGVIDPAVTVVSAAERDRIVRLIQIGIDRADVSLRTAYDITIDPDQAALIPLNDLRQIDSVSWNEALGEGPQTIEVKGMNPKQPVTALVAVELAARPMVVVARESLRRGHIITSSDLELASAERNVAIKDALTSIDELVGMQVQTVLAKGKPILKNSIGPVILVERGDLVEVHVLGGGYWSRQAPEHWTEVPKGR